MTNWMKELKPYELDVWKNGSTWQRARIAYRHGHMEELNPFELCELENTVAEMNFYAEMSDDYQTTRREKRENNAIAAEATRLLEV